MADYQNVPYKLYNQGICVALPPDIIGENKYTRLTNVRNLQEGQTVSRYGLVRSEWGTSCGWIIYMRKINDNLFLFVLSDGQVFVNANRLLIYDDVLGVGVRTGTDAFPNPETGTFPRFPLVLTNTEDISLVKLTNAFAGEDWAYFATQDGMWKIDPKGVAYKWGIRPPFVTSVQDDGTPKYTPTNLTATIQDCPADAEGDYGCGLDSSSANTTPYSWSYTYYNSRTGSESNPSAQMPTEVTGLVDTTYNGATLTRRGQAVKLVGFVPPTDPQVDRLRVYRYGGSLNEYLLEQEVPWDTTEFVSFQPDDFLRSSTQMSFNNDVPFTSTIPRQNSEDIPADYVEVDDEFGIIKPFSVFETPMGRAWGPFAGSYIFAAGDTYRPSVVYWTNAGAPDGASDLNEVQVCANSEPIQNGFVFGGNSFVFTKDNLYGLDWGGPTAPTEFVPRQIPQGMGLSAPDALAVGTQGVFFLSKDGVYLTDCSSFCKSITQESLKPIFLGQSVSEFGAFEWAEPWLRETHMTVAAQELHFVYWSRMDDGTRERVHLVYDTLSNRWQRFAAASDLMTAFVYASENESRYKVWMALSDGKVYYVADGEPGRSSTGGVLDFEEGDQVAVNDPSGDILVPFLCKFRTGAADLGSPLSHKEFGVLMVDADTLGRDVYITPFYDAETIVGAPLVLNCNGREVKTFSLGDVYHKNMSLDFKWPVGGNGSKATFYQITALVRMDEEEIVHWEHPDSSMHISGWKHIRDLYVGLRSTGVVRLRIEVDGMPYDYFLPTTMGQRRKVYVKLDPTKGKVFRFSLDSEFVVAEMGLETFTKGPPFRMYKDDSFYYVKPWHTGNTYQKIQLGGEASAF